MKLEWRQSSDAVLCIVPEGKMYAYHSNMPGNNHWYIPIVATILHDGILPVSMNRETYETADAAINAMEAFYFKAKELPSCENS